MNIEEAIGIIRRNWQEQRPVSLEDYDKAIQLGIEALEREMLYRQRLIGMKAWADIELLPSEKEE